MDAAYRCLYLYPLLGTDILLLPDLTASTVEDSTLSLWQSARDLLLPAWAERLVSYLIYAVIGYSLIELNNRFGIIRMRRPCRQPYTFCWSLSARKCTCYMQETLQPLLSCSPFISCSKVISSRRQQAIYSIPSFSSEREACFSPTHLPFGTLDIRSSPFSGTQAP